jgi:hypothetical protein
LEKETALQFAQEWIAAWNKHDITAILSHYNEELAFYSPLIPVLNFNTSGVITSKADLEKYFEIGLAKFPELHFEFHNCFVGNNTVVIYYTSVNGKLCAEVFELNEAGKAVKVFCNYSDVKSV